MQVLGQAGMAYPVLLSFNTDRKLWIISTITNYLSLIMIQTLCCLAPQHSELSQVFIAVLVTFPSLHQPCKETPFFYHTHRHDNNFVCCCLSFYSSKAEETALLCSSPVSFSTLCSCSALSSFLSSFDLLLTSLSLGKTGGRGQTVKAWVMSGWARGGMKGEQEVRLKLETNLFWCNTDVQDNSSRPLPTSDS